MKNETKKLEFITNFKGVLALLVLLHHFALCFYPILVNGEGFDLTNKTELLTKIINSPFNILGYGGSLAVSLFFIISGFLISYSFYNKNLPIDSKKIVKRYLDLLFPILFSCIFAFVLGKIFLNYNLFNNLVNTSYYQNLNYNFYSLIKSSIFGIFTTANAIYNPPLWTMSGELFGSIMIYFLLMIFPYKENTNKKNYYIYFFLLIMFFNNYKFYFIIGLIFAKIYCHDKEKIYDIKLITKFILLILILYLSGYCYLNTNSKIYLPLTNFFNLFTYLESDSVSVIKNISSSLIFLLILSSKSIQKILSLKIFNIFGKYSTELYLFHWPILYTVVLKITSFIYYKSYHYFYSTLLGIILLIVLTFIISYIYHNLLEIYIKKLKNKIYKLFCN